jgi:hypothetical protein
MDLAAMFAYFTTTGLDVDTPALHRAYPDITWHTFADWTAGEDWGALLGQ